MRYTTRVTHPDGCGTDAVLVVIKSTPTKLPSQPPQDNRHVPILGLDPLSTSAGYYVCLHSSPGHVFLDEGCRFQKKIPIFPQQQRHENSLDCFLKAIILIGNFHTSRFICQHKLSAYSNCEHGPIAIICLTGGLLPDRPN